MEKLKYIDLFCGIGGFRVAMEQACAAQGRESVCVFSSDIDPHCRKSYAAYFGDEPVGDITAVAEGDVPPHHLLFAGFPCQPFSILGQQKGFADTRGTLFFHIERILRRHRPTAFVLENVRQLITHDRGRTLAVIIETLQKMDYQVQYKALNALDYGLPQKRERVIIVGTLSQSPFVFPPPQKGGLTLADILEKEVDPKHYASEKIVQSRKSRHTSLYQPAIWHENKSANISSHPYSCALRAGGSYNYLLVDGERRLTPREMFRLQGFPDSYPIVVADTQARKQAGNSVPVNMIQAVLESLLESAF